MSPPANALDLCWEFLLQPADRRLKTLRVLGLERYQQLLCQLPPTAANQQCLLSFLANPQSVKFPQLPGANLAGLQLQGLNLIRANFTGAQLQGCCLRSADLLFGNFTGADLSQADLRDCTLNESRWPEAIVVGCDLRGAKGLTSEQQQQLQTRGAIFSKVRRAFPHHHWA